MTDTVKYEKCQSYFKWSSLGKRVPTGWRDTGFHYGDSEAARKVAQMMKSDTSKSHKVKKFGYREYAVLRRMRA